MRFGFKATHTPFPGLPGALVFTALALNGAVAHAAPVTSTLNNVTLLGTTYNVTFSQNLANENGSSFTTFNDVFGVDPSPALTFDSATVQAATQALLLAVATDHSFDVTPGTSVNVGGGFLIPYAVDAVNLSYMQGVVNVSYGNYSTYPAGLYSGLRTSPSSASFVTFAAVAPVPEPASMALMISGLGMVGWLARGGRKPRRAATRPETTPRSRRPIRRCGSRSPS